MPDTREPASLSLQSPASERAPMIALLRAIFLVLLIVFTALIIVTDSASAIGGSDLLRWWPLTVLGVLLFFAGVLALDVLIPKRKLSTLTAIFVGLLAGVVVTAILGVVFDLFTEVYDFGGKRILEPFKVLLGMGICYLTISTVLQTQDDFRLVIPYVEFAKKVRGARPLLIDTSALIDGRVQELAHTGIFQSSLLIPSFVIEELQRLSDSADKFKRARGRRGLELVAKLQRTATVDVKIEESSVSGTGVDQMIIELARALPAMILTTDSGLARVAAIQGVACLNLADIATAMRPTALAGDVLSLHVLRRGEQPGQGVGYLSDGTMVVVEQGESRVGHEVRAVVTGSVQTASGKLVFARLEVDSGEHSRDAEPAASDAGGPSVVRDGQVDVAQPAGPVEARVAADDAPIPPQAEPAPRPRERGPFGPQRGGEAGPRPTPRNPRRG